MSGISSSSRARWRRSSPSTRATAASSSATKSAGRAFGHAERRSSSRSDEELRDLREVREALRPPLLRERLEPSVLGARERLRDDEVANAGRVREDAELGAARHLGRVLDLHPEPEVGLVASVLRHRVVVARCAGTAAAARSRPTRLERADDGGLHHVEHVLALDERHLEVELAELELPVGAEVLVTPARRDLVVAVEPADHAELLEELRRLREREELPGLQPDRDEEVARALGRAARHRRRPDVDEAELVHRPADAGDRGVRSRRLRCIRSPRMSSQR